MNTPGRHDKAGRHRRPAAFDLNAPVVKIEDEDYALFYRDIPEEPDV